MEMKANDEGEGLRVYIPCELNADLWKRAQADWLEDYMYKYSLCKPHFALWLPKAFLFSFTKLTAGNYYPSVGLCPWESCFFYLTAIASQQSYAS